MLDEVVEMLVEVELIDVEVVLTEVDEVEVVVPLCG